jgi:hypothetical protein
MSGVSSVFQKKIKKFFKGAKSHENTGDFN